MSVEFGTCAGCGGSTCDVDLTACDCGMQFCAPPDGKECGDIQENEDTGETTCKFCRKEAITDADLLQWCLERLDMTREQAEKKALKP